MLEPLPEKLNYSELEHETLKFWEDNNIFEKTLEKTKDNEYFSFYEGPPTVNGKPGVHHLIARTIKDTVCRYKTMQGYFVRRQAGWDTHGLPVEIAVEKKLGLKDKDDIIEYGIDKFNEECRKFVYHNIDMDLGWGYLTRRMGYWLNLDEAYITCTQEYVESIWWALKQYFDKGLIYKGFKVVPQSPTIETPLSSHELSLGYKDVRDPNCYIKLKVLNSPKKSIESARLLVWTTTPWTLLSNTATAVGNDIDYVHVKNTRKIKDETQVDELVLAESRLGALDGEYEILDKFKGSEIVGTVYEQIFPYLNIDREKYPNALTVLAGDFVSTEDGSGIVHMAPAFGEDDYEMSKKFNLPFFQPVTPNGHFTEDMGEFAGRAIKNFTYEDHTEEGADKDLIIWLKKNDKIYRTANDYLHSYPHCWRTGNPLMYYARESWFIKSPEYKDKMIAQNNEIKWQPPEIGAGRFGNWLEEVKDWSLSRDRFWGTPLPIWINEDDQEDMFAVGSIEELIKGLYEFEDGNRVPVPECGKEIDLHRPFVDNVVFEKDGHTYRRVHEVIDVWFDSGSMPFAQMHYPFENKELFEKSFPGDFIAEGIDQTRGWFYTLHNIAVALFDKPAYKNIVVNELILDEKGEKMSKSKGNTVDPFDIMEKFGADAVRWYLYVNNPPWKPTRFSESDLAKTVISDFFRSLTNTYSFMALYANIDGYEGKNDIIPVKDRPEIDRWIISRINSLLKEYIYQMEDYDFTKASRAIQSFTIYELSNWYIRRNRRRFWKGEYDNDKISAYQTLHEVLLLLVAMIAPAAPFLSENLYRKIKHDGMPESIHLLDFPNVDENLIDSQLEEKMDIAQSIVSLARMLREKSRIRVRQPLERILLPVNSPQERRNIQSVEDIIKEELNIKRIDFVTEDTENVVRRSAKANFKVIGKKFGKMTQKVAKAIAGMKDSDIKELEKNGALILNADGEDVDIVMEDIEIHNEDIEGWLVATEGIVTVALDTQLSEELKQEGLAREFVSRIQNLRKDSGFEVTDRIKILYNTDEPTKKALENQKDYIQNETLAEELSFASDIPDSSTFEIDDINISLNISKV